MSVKLEQMTQMWYNHAQLNSKAPALRKQPGARPNRWRRSDMSTLPQYLAARKRDTRSSRLPQDVLAKIDQAYESWRDTSCAHHVWEVLRYHVLNNLPVGLTSYDWQATLTFFNHACAYCGRDDVILHMEHIVPRSAGGGFVKNNIVPACCSCNSSKHNNAIRDWLNLSRLNPAQAARLRTWLDVHGILSKVEVLPVRDKQELVSRMSDWMFADENN